MARSRDSFTYGRKTGAIAYRPRTNTHGGHEVCVLTSRISVRYAVDLLVYELNPPRFRRASQLREISSDLPRPYLSCARCFLWLGGLFYTVSDEIRLILPPRDENDRTGPYLSRATPTVAGLISFEENSRRNEESSRWWRTCGILSRLWNDGGREGWGGITEQGVLPKVS